MTEHEFLRNNRGIDNGKDLPATMLTLALFKQRVLNPCPVTQRLVQRDQVERDQDGRR